MQYVARIRLPSVTLTRFGRPRHVPLAAALAAEQGKTLPIVSSRSCVGKVQPPAPPRSGTYSMANNCSICQEGIHRVIVRRLAQIGLFGSRNGSGEARMRLELRLPTVKPGEMR